MIGFYNYEYWGFNVIYLEVTEAVSLAIINSLANTPQLQVLELMPWARQMWWVEETQIQKWDLVRDCDDAVMGCLVSHLFSCVLWSVQLRWINSLARSTSQPLVFLNSIEYFTSFKSRRIITVSQNQFSPSEATDRFVYFWILWIKYWSK